MSFVRPRFHAYIQSHYQGSEVSLRDLREHLLHTLTLRHCFYSQLLSFYLDLPLDVVGAVCYQFGLTAFFISHLVPVLSRLSNYKGSYSCSYSARASMQTADW